MTRTGPSALYFTVSDEPPACLNPMPDVDGCTCFACSAKITPLRVGDRVSRPIRVGGAMVEDSFHIGIVGYDHKSDDLRVLWTFGGSTGITAQGYPMRGWRGFRALPGLPEGRSEPAALDDEALSTYLEVWETLRMATKARVSRHQKGRVVRSRKRAALQKELRGMLVRPKIPETS